MGALNEAFWLRVYRLSIRIGIQEKALRAAGCQTIRLEKKSGSEPGSRTELPTLLDFLRTGDTLVVTRIDRLARSMKDFQDIVHDLNVRVISLKATEQPTDTGTAAGKAFLDMLGMFAELKPIYAVSGRPKGSPLQKRGAFIRGGKARIDPEAIRKLADPGMRLAISAADSEFRADRYIVFYAQLGRNRFSNQ